MKEYYNSISILYNVKHKVPNAWHPQPGYNNLEHFSLNNSGENELFHPKLDHTDTRDNVSLPPTYRTVRISDIDIVKNRWIAYSFYLWQHRELSI
jgi:hypothetical protein